MSAPSELEVVANTEPDFAAELAANEIEGRSLGRIAWTRLKRDRVAMAALVVIIIIVAVAIFGSLINDAIGNQPNQFNSSLINGDTDLPGGGFSGVSSAHWLGVEPVNGRDILARLIVGTRVSIFISLSAMLLSLVLGLIVGVASGYYRGFADTILARTMDLLLAFPTLLFSISLLAIFNSSKNGAFGLKGLPLNFTVLIFVIGFFGFPYVGRIVRGQVLSIREREFIDAARSLGASDWRILTREILPNLVGPVLVWATLTIPNYIIAEAGLSFLGVGIQEPTSSWGKMLSTAGNWFQIDPAYLFWPGLTLFFTVAAFNLFGDGLRDALDPKSGR